MPRSIVTGNGNLLVALDYQNMVEDLYFPYVGMEDQIAFEHKLRMGVYTDNHFSWMYESDWHHETRYLEDTLITDSSAVNRRLELEVAFNDFVYPTDNVFIRKIKIKNTADRDRHIKFYFGQDFHLYGDKQQDTAFYEPDHKAVVHFRKHRYFWISGMTQSRVGIDSFTTGKSEYRGLEGTWRDAEDGHLHENPIEQGSVDSTVEFNLMVKRNEETVLYFWICAGKDIGEVTALHKFILDESAEKLMRNTVNYWQSWVNKEQTRLKHMPSDFQKAYKQSLLIIRTQIDNRGAILAANDSDIMKFNKDTYSYMWPRDGAWVAHALNHAGYGEISRRFFEFCAQVITKDGYLLHKYNPDLSVGSSWHPWYKDGEKQMPIQEDETAIVLWSLLHHYKQFGDIEFIQEMYSRLIRRAGNFMTYYLDDKTDLPLPSYDLWERERGIFSYTCASVYAGLMAAAELSKVVGHFNHHKRYEKAGEKVKRAILRYLYDEEAGHFLKRIQIDPHTGDIKKDYALDASLHGIWLFGLLPPDDPRVVRTNEAIYKKLWVNTPVQGLARSENDDYQRVHGNYRDVPGNPWIITTLWHAQWKLAVAQELDDLKEVENILKWAMSHMNPAGILPEQINPFNGDPLSVAPLTWSHSTFAETVLRYSEKLQELQKSSGSAV